MRQSRHSLVSRRAARFATGVLSTVALLAVTLGMLSWTHADADGFRFNQLHIEGQAAKHGVRYDWQVAETGTAPAQGPDPIGRPIRRENVDPADPASMLRLVLAAAPKNAVVYPSAGYYYFSGTWQGKAVRGNLNFRDAARGIVHLYYRHGTAAAAHRARFALPEGVRVTAVAAGTYEVRHRDVTRRFRLHDGGGSRTTTIPLLEAERIAARVTDESGLRFHLVFDAKAAGFRYVLDESRGVADSLTALAPRLQLGATTGFVFLQEAAPARRLLVAVARRSVERNDAFDGPFDQVPDGSALRELLHAAYPYTILERPIDADGYFLDATSGHSRVAIAPYYHYDDRADLLSHVRLCEAASESPSQLRECLAYEAQNER